MVSLSYIEPLVLVFVVFIFIGVVRLRHSRGFLLPAAGATALLLLSWPPVDWLLSRPLEAWYPVRPFRAAPAQAIVVLAVSVSPPLHERPYALPDHHTYERCEFAAWLYKHWQPVPVLACGGPASPGEQPLSAAMRQLLQRAGVPEGMIWTEERSRSTHENALYGAEILRQRGIRRIALVGEAQGMLRAEVSFRKQGMAVVPAPCAFREFDASLEEFIPTWKAISRNEGTLHESLGLAWYWLRGWL